MTEIDAARLLALMWCSGLFLGVLVFFVGLWR